MTLPVPGNAGVAVAPASGPALSINDTDQKLIMELVAEISPPVEVLARYGLTKAELEAKFRRDRMFLAAFREAKRTWTSDLNVHERIKWKAAMLLEDSLLALARIIQDEHMSAAAKRDAIETLGKLADAWEPGKRRGEQAPAANVKISINLGESAPIGVVVEGQATPVEWPANE